MHTGRGQVMELPRPGVPASVVGLPSIWNCRDALAEIRCVPDYVWRIEDSGQRQNVTMSLSTALRRAGNSITTLESTRCVWNEQREAEAPAPAADSLRDTLRFRMKGLEGRLRTAAVRQPTTWTRCVRLPMCFF